MTRQAALRCLRSLKAKNASKPKLNIWLANTKTTACASKLTSPKPNPCLSNNHRHQFCTSNTVSSLKHLTTVTRSEPELVGPAKPTPRGLKQLSFMDDRGDRRMLLPTVQAYRHDPSMHGVDPARAIREALARALVFYYPLAGRLREGRDGELSVDCTGEGVSFVEADADVELSQLGDPPQTHLPWFEDFLYNHDPPLFGEILNSPLFYIQVTRLKCGGFILALRFNHIMCDGGGLTQFLTCMGEIARGAHTPSITPVWKRELFRFSNPKHKNADRPTVNIPVVNNLNLAQRSMFIGPSELLAIRTLVPEHMRARATNFEILTAFLWRCRTRALQLNLDQDDPVYLAFTVNARDKTNRVIPGGYYGNAFTGAVVESGARMVCEGPIEYAIGLIKKAKEESGKMHMSWGTDTPIIGMDLYHYPWGKSLFVTDTRQLGYGDVDFGWGKPVYAGLAKSEMDGVFSYAPYTTRGEDGIVASICLQAQTMRSFETEFNNINRN